MGGGEGVCRGQVQKALRVALISLVIIAIWSPGIDGPYHFDDYVTPLQDPASQSLSAWLYWLPDTLRPLTKLTYALEGSLGGDLPASVRRLPAILFHCAAAVSLFFLFLLQPNSGPVPAALLTLLWALHPVHAESVLAVHGRSTALANFLLITVLLAYLKNRTVTAGVLLVLAGLAKETALAGIVPLVVLEMSAGNRCSRIRAVRLLPSALALVFLVCWYLSTPRYLALADFSLQGRPWFESVVRQVAAVPVGLSLYIYPSALSIDYGLSWPDTPASFAFCLGLMLYLLGSTGILLALRRAPFVAIGLGLWMASLLPTQSLVPKLDPLADRPLTLALAGLLIAAAPPVLSRIRLANLRLLFPVTVAGLAGWLALATLSRGSLYESELTLWSDAAGKSVSNPRPHLNQALLLGAAGRFREADSALAEAVRIDPLDPRVRLVSRQLELRQSQNKAEEPDT